MSATMDRSELPPLLIAVSLFAALTLPVILLAQTAGPREQPPPAKRAPGTMIYQDFRASRPLLPSLKLVGPDARAVTKPEEEGLRITLPATRPVNHPVAVVTTFSLSGDFEITGTYELLSGNRPTKGYGVGVSLNLANNNARDRFAKVGRAWRVQEGSVYVTEFWTNRPPKDYQSRSVPTEARAGQLRLVREGSIIRHLVADGPENTFREIYQKDFGTEDLAHVRFEVSDSGSPGNAVDARLVDLRIRSGQVIPDEDADSAPTSEQERKAGSKGWLAAGLILGLVTTLFIALGVWLSRRRANQQRGG